MPTLLSHLRARSQIDCDTLSLPTAVSLGPFIDCTSNQAIACFEAQKPEHEQLLQRSGTLAQELSPRYPDVSVEALAVEVVMISLALRMTPHISGCSHVQTNPLDSHSTPRMIAGGERIVLLFTHLAPDFDTQRICIKIPSTWEGLQACKVLEAKGIKTLATTLFTIEQAALAGEVGCHYIAPYVNELAVHFDRENGQYFDVSPNPWLCALAQRYYEVHGVKTKVLAASLTSVKECMLLSGLDHITIAPVLLEQLAETHCEDVEAEFPSVCTREERDAILEHALAKFEFLKDEAAFHMAMTRSTGWYSTAKLAQAINIFIDFQEKLEQLVKPFCHA